MAIADNVDRLVVAGGIAAAHALGIYMLMTFAPEWRTLAAAIPVSVRFLAQPEQPQNPRPPEVRAVTQRVTVDLPQLPMLDIAVAAPPSERAITIPAQPASPPQVSDSNVPRLVEAVEYLRQPSPRYPPQSRRLREQGLVVLRVVIDEQGSACDIEIETSSGYARLDNAAREAVERAAFRPYVEDGAPRRALVLIPIEFALNRSAA